jgi:ethanolamine transporter EutH
MNAAYRNNHRLDGGDIIFRILVLLIPVVNVIAGFLWAFGGQTEETRRFGKIVLVVMILGLMGAIFFGLYGMVLLRGLQPLLG